MLNIHKKTTNISTERHLHLEVEWCTHHPHVVQPDGRFKQIEEHVVALVAPANKMHEQIYLVGMTPGTAYNLYKWLHNNIETIKVLSGVVDEHD